ncbi:inositol monophosphatase family protein [Saccharothrix obliqua]|uniref:inositol monophosphatase family protein n=1 Tax=Saccharothrix obliqua TaxID=2861747 RepID=UPI001C5F72FC|nr:inositol monophosphatase family protein [Saccharothrix obliqua]MBW4719711.1 inositol monophosphatase [Saccharothrix obliqua]
MRNDVIEIVREVAAGIPALRPGRPPTSRDAMFRVFQALDEPLSAALRARLPEGEWVLDALDGAVQFLQGLPQWCVTATLVEHGEPVLAVLHSPLLGETYSAERGAGAWRDGVRIAPSRKTELAAAVAATSQPPALAPQPAANALAGRKLPAVVDRVAAVRNLGPTSWQVADVGAGRLDLFWEFGLDAENLLGASLVAREAGATVTTAGGDAWHAGAESFLVAAPGLHAAAVGLLG